MFKNDANNPVGTKHKVNGEWIDIRMQKNVDTDDSYILIAVI